MVDTEKMVFVNHKMLQHLFADANAKVLANDVERMRKSFEDVGKEVDEDYIFHFVVLLTMHISEVQKLFEEELFKEKGKEE